MIEQKQINHSIIAGLKSICGCEVIRANQTNPLPRYPFISYNIVTIKTKAGTYSEYEDGEKEKELLQTWSLTIHSDDDAEALKIAMLAHDWLEEIGNGYLNDYGIVVRNIGEISNRDNLITIEYEYRKGFDTTFAVINEITEKTNEIIEKANFKVV